MSFLDSLNHWSQSILGVRIFDLPKQASQSKIAAQKAEELARNRHFKEAVCIVERTLNLWSSHPSFWERLMRRWLLGNLLKQLQGQLAQWQSQLFEADKLVYEAKTLQERSSDPLETQTLSQAIALYQRHTEVVYEESVLEAINQCQKEIQKRQQFRELITAAEVEVQQKFFESAIALYHQAKQLYSTEAIKSALDTYNALLRHEKTYEAALKLAQQGFKDGRLQWAMTLLESALANFTRSDGIDLLEQIKLVLRGKQKFRQGLKAEQLGNLNEAASMYAEAKELLYDSTECLLRLGVVAIKTEDWAKSQFYLKGLPGEQAAYLRGVAYTNEGNLQQAHREWQPLTQTTMEPQRQVLKSLAQSQRLLLLQNIEQLVKNENWQDAQAASNAFIQKFGCDPVVEGNLEAHIQPRIAAAVWENPNWKTIIDRVEQVWIEQPNFTSLHNWAIATYYYAIVQPQATRDFAASENLIIALSTALANLRGDPSLQNVPWLGDTPVDYEAVTSELLRRIEEVIEGYKSQNFDEYLQLRDRYRLEMVSLRLIASSPPKGLRIQKIFITPGCYQLYKQKLKNITFPANLWGALYTAWGLAVAACFEGDTQRAIQLIPSIKAATEADLFAQKFVAYHHGSYYLQQQKWREAMLTLKQAQAEIRASTDWQQEIDRLCGLQRQNYLQFAEYLEFAQLWYDLLASLPARSYLAEYKAYQIQEQLNLKVITDKQALQELKALQQIDAQNPVALGLIDSIELNQEFKNIQYAFTGRAYAEAIRLARKSRHERIHYLVAKGFVDIAVETINNSSNLNKQEIITQLGGWAYELCPYEPTFQDFYRQLKLY